MPGGIKWTTYLAAVAVTLASSYPFYAVVQELRDLQPRSLIPCSDEPCQYMRIFSGAGIPNTWPFIVQVQNGVSRPVVFTGYRSGAAPVLYKQRPPRSLMLFVGYIMGGFVEQPFVNASDYHESIRACYLGVCIDDHWQFLFPWNYLGEQPTIFNETAQEAYKEIVQKYLDKDNATQLAVANLREVEASGQRQSELWHSLLWLPRVWQQGIINALVWVFRVMFAGSGSLSGVELTPSARCADADVDVRSMQDTCEERRQRDAFSESFANPVQQGRVTPLCLTCIACWAALKALHDIMLLRGFGEELTMTIGLASLAFQGASAGSGALTVMSAAQVFVAEAGSACSCYYKLDDFRLILSIATPLLLTYAYFAKKRMVLQAMLSGDYLYFKTFDVPFRVVRENSAWQGSDLLVPHVLGDSGAPQSVAVAGRDGRVPPWLARVHRYYGRLMMCEWIFLRCPIMFAMTTFLPRWMAVLSVSAMGSAREDVFQTALTYMLLTAPALIYFGLKVEDLTARKLYKWSSNETCRQQVQERLKYMIWLLPGLLLLPPMEVWSLSSRISPGLLLWHQADWTFGCWSLLVAIMGTLSRIVGSAQMGDLVNALASGDEEDVDREFAKIVEVDADGVKDMEQNYLLQDLMKRQQDRAEARLLTLEER